RQAAAASRMRVQASPLALTARQPPKGTGGAPIGGGSTHRRASGRGSSYSPGQVYTGTGFDVCATPSPSRMSAWSSSYHAVGVYIGGTNMACSQPNLTASWVSQESAAGWHLIPIYVGLQAPQNDCGCAGISPSRASSQGQA